MPDAVCRLAGEERICDFRRNHDRRQLANSLSRCLKLRDHGRAAFHDSRAIALPVCEVLKIRNVDQTDDAFAARVVVWVHEVFALLAEVGARDAARWRVRRAKDHRDLSRRIDAFVSIDLFRLNKPSGACEDELAADVAGATCGQIIGAGCQCASVDSTFV